MKKDTRARVSPIACFSGEKLPAADVVVKSTTNITLQAESFLNEGHSARTDGAFAHIMVTDPRSPTFLIAVASLRYAVKLRNAQLRARRDYPTAANPIPPSDMKRRTCHKKKHKKNGTKPINATRHAPVVRMWSQMQ